MDHLRPYSPDGLPTMTYPEAQHFLGQTHTGIVTGQLTLRRGILEKYLQAELTFAKYQQEKGTASNTDTSLHKKRVHDLESFTDNGSLDLAGFCDYMIAQKSAYYRSYEQKARQGDAYSSQKLEEGNKVLGAWNTAQALLQLPDVDNTR